MHCVVPSPEHKPHLRSKNDSKVLNKIRKSLVAKNTNKILPTLPRSGGWYEAMKSPAEVTKAKGESQVRSPNLGQILLQEYQTTDEKQTWLCCWCSSRWRSHSSQRSQTPQEAQQFHSVGQGGNLSPRIKT